MTISTALESAETKPFVSVALLPFVQETDENVSSGRENASNNKDNVSSGEENAPTFKTNVFREKRKALNAEKATPTRGKENICPQQCFYPMRRKKCSEGGLVICAKRPGSVNKLKTFPVDSVVLGNDEAQVDKLIGDIIQTIPFDFGGEIAIVATGPRQWGKSQIVNAVQKKFIKELIEISKGKGLRTSEISSVKVGVTTELFFDILKGDGDNVYNPKLKVRELDLLCGPTLEDITKKFVDNNEDIDSVFSIINEAVVESSFFLSGGKTVVEERHHVLTSLFLNFGDGIESHRQVRVHIIDLCGAEFSGSGREVSSPPKQNRSTEGEEDQEGDKKKFEAVNKRIARDDKTLKAFNKIFDMFKLSKTKKIDLKIAGWRDSAITRLTQGAIGGDVREKSGSKCFVLVPLKTEKEHFAETESIVSFLSSVGQIRGAAVVGNGKVDRRIYSCCPSEEIEILKNKIVELGGNIEGDSLDSQISKIVIGDGEDCERKAELREKLVELKFMKKFFNKVE